MFGKGQDASVEGQDGPVAGPDDEGRGAGKALARLPPAAQRGAAPGSGQKRTLSVTWRVFAFPKSGSSSGSMAYW